MISSAWNIVPATEADLSEVRFLVSEALAVSPSISAGDQAFLEPDIDQSLTGWLQSGGQGVFMKALDSRKLAGFVVVKEYWNLSHLFVHPDQQRAGLGSLLFNEAVELCRQEGTQSEVRLNSSTDGEAFYRSAGCIQSGPALDRPGGSIPFRYSLTRGTFFREHNSLR